jgi:ATP-dependent Clp protease ATP-binding subunit ClpA
MVAAQLLCEVGIVVTFEPTLELSALLDQLHSRDAVVDDVLDFVNSNSKCREEKPSMFERFTPRARQVLSEAKHAAEDLRHNFIGTEHLLLGLLAVEDGIAAHVLHELGVASGEVKWRVQELVGTGPKAVVDNFPFTPRSKKTLELAFRHALSFGQDYIGTEHILLGLLDVEEGLSSQILRAMGVSRGRAEEKITAALVAHGWTPPSKKARRRRRLQGFAPVTFPPTSPVTQVRNQRLVQELTGVISENDTLRAEIDRLRRLLDAHHVDPGQAAPGEQPA